MQSCNGLMPCDRQADMGHALAWWRCASNLCSLAGRSVAAEEQSKQAARTEVEEACRAWASVCTVRTARGGRQVPAQSSALAAHLRESLTLFQVFITSDVALQDEFAVEHLWCRAWSYKDAGARSARLATSCSGKGAARVWPTTPTCTHRLQAQLQQVVVRDGRFGRHRTARNTLSRR